MVVGKDAQGRSGVATPRATVTGSSGPGSRRLPETPVTRFAPSPTGLLHLGHVANAIWVWGVAQASRGRVILRIEDHDRTRCRPEYEARILEDLEWLGLEPDEASRASLVGEGPSPFRQSDCGPAYEDLACRLAQVAKVFVCGCSRKAIARAGREVPPERGEIRYPGTCRTRGLEPGPGRGLRVVLPDHAVQFEDLRHGPVTQHPAVQCGDLLLRDRNGNWTYQLCVTADDLRQGVTLVVRGDDLLESTGRQILLRRLLGGGAPPAFLHHPLIEGAVPGVKLSKRDRAAGLAVLRDAGRSPASVLGEAAFLTGLLRDRRALEARDLGDLFAGWF